MSLAAQVLKQLDSRVKLYFAQQAFEHVIWWFDGPGLTLLFWARRNWNPLDRIFVAQRGEMLRHLSLGIDPNIAILAVQTFI